MEIENRDDDREVRARRAARLAQMRKEKQLQEQRRRMIRKLLPMGAGVLGIIIIIIAAVVVLGKKTGTDEGQQAQAAENGLQQAQIETPVEQINSTDSMEQMDEESMGQDDAVKEAIASASSISQIFASTPVYTFEPTPDTATIYSEEVISTNAILINESTDTIVASKGAKERISPASMTKVLTILVAAEQLTEENLDDTFTMTREITDYAYVNDCSTVGFLDGEKVPVRDLFYGTTLHSGGDAAVGLATYVAGSHEAFVDMMNAKLEAMGLADCAHFTNCVGLYDVEHYCTVYDMAVIMKAAMQNEMCREFLSAHSYTTTPTTEHPEGIEISNWFLRRIEDKDTGGEVLCAKTGYVVQSKNCAVSYGTFEGGTPYICVTAGSTSSWRCIYDHVEIYNRYVQADE